MNYDQPLNRISFERFNHEEVEGYKRHLKPENAVIFRKSADLLEAVENWLQDQYPGGEFVAAKGKRPMSDAVIVLPKASGEVNRDFSKDVHESKLAKRKSKLGPQ